MKIGRPSLRFLFFFLSFCLSKRGAGGGFEFMILHFIRVFGFGESYGSI